jgi:hypothetical protein
MFPMSGKKSGNKYFGLPKKVPHNKVGKKCVNF